MSQLTTRDYKGTAPRPRGAGGLSQFLWGTLAGALLAGLGAALIVHHTGQAARVCAGTGIAAPPAAPAGRAQGAATPPGPVPAGSVPEASSGGDARSPASSSSSIRGSGGRQSGRSGRDASPAQAPQDTLARGASQGPSLAAHRASTPQYDFYQMLPNLRVTVPPPSAPGARSVGPGGRRRFAGYVLQVGAYNSEAHARKVVAYLDSLGTLAHIDPMRDGAQTLYRVRIGPVIERWELDRFRHQLKLVGLPAMLVPGATH